MHVQDPSLMRRSEVQLLNSLVNALLHSVIAD